VGITSKEGFRYRVGGAGPTEITADLFTNYILGSFTGPGADGINLEEIMSTNIVALVESASLYSWK
jgi:hypothetical protein